MWKSYKAQQRLYEHWLWTFFVAVLYLKCWKKLQYSLLLQLFQTNLYRVNYLELQKHQKLIWKWAAATQHIYCSLLCHHFTLSWFHYVMFLKVLYEIDNTNIWSNQTFQILCLIWMWIWLWIFAMILNIISLYFSGEFQRIYILKMKKKFRIYQISNCFVKLIAIIVSFITSFCFLGYDIHHIVKLWHYTY